ncbi:MAG: TetR/AcrR family transcriptional regulator [Candidatus Hermodarchaeota archaeon]
MARGTKIKARSEEEKAEQYKRILDAGTDLFINDGSFSMRALARKLGMSEAFVYTYIASKRELWIAIRTRYFNQYKKALQDIYDNHQGELVDFFMNWVKLFLEFVAADYNRFKMMFLVSAPHSHKIGPLEKRYKRFDLFEMGLNNTREILKRYNRDIPNIRKIIYFLFSIVFGAAKIEADLKLRYDITEPINLKEELITQEEFRNFVINQVKQIIESFLE